jgi:RNA polymerase sigma-70 factor, ECF subfamily
MCPARSAHAPELTDVSLMLKVQAGERGALGELYDRLAPRAFRTALACCHDRECAEDAVQDGFVSMWSSRATYSPRRESVEGWAMSIVRHRAIFLARTRSLTARREDVSGGLDKQPAQDDVPSDFAARAEIEQLEKMLARLPPKQREVIKLGFFNGLTHEQIARQLDLPAGTVKGRMRLGLTKLRTELDNRY